MSFSKLYTCIELIVNHSSHWSSWGPSGFCLSAVFNHSILYLINIAQFWFIYLKFLLGPEAGSLLRRRSGWSDVTLPVPTRLFQTDIHSFLGVLRLCLLGPMSPSFSCHCKRCTNHRREHSQENESHTLIGLFPRKECMSVWSSRMGMGRVTWLRPERLRRRLWSRWIRQEITSLSRDE